MIVAGSQSQILASRIAKKSSEKLACVEYERFPDGELLVSVPEIQKAKRSIIVASTTTERSWIELLQLIDICSETSHVDLVIPYMGYSRQDKKFEPGQPISARALITAIDGVDSVTTINIHESSVLDWFDCSTQNLDASSVLTPFFDVDSPIVLSPDKGAIDLAQNVASSIGGDSDFLEKERISGDKVEITPKNLGIKDQDVIVVDDMISTGGTMTEAIEMLKKQGPSSVSVGCIHPVFAENAVLRLFSTDIEKIVTTDTIETTLSKATVSQVITNSVVE